MLAGTLAFDRQVHERPSENIAATRVVHGDDPAKHEVVEIALGRDPTLALGILLTLDLLGYWFDLHARTLQVA